MSMATDRVLVGYGKRTWLAHPSSRSQPHFYSPDFFLTSSQPWFTHEFFREFEITALSQLLASHAIQPSAKLNVCWIPPDRSCFQEAFTDLQRRFAARELLKAVPYCFEKSTQQVSSEILAGSLISLLNKTVAHSMHLYGCWEQGRGILGGSPEILFSFENETLKTMACAGTRRLADKGNSIEQEKLSLLADPKERHEHQLVIDGISESLAAFGKISQDQTTVLQFPGLLHLITPIQLKLDAVESSTVVSRFNAFVRALHPTPALGAFPKQAGWLWLKHYQTIINRQRYGAPFGCLREEGSTAVCLVAIRNMQWDEQGIALGAGCGVVPESHPDKEWQEIHAKLHSIKTILGLL